MATFIRFIAGETIDVATANAAADLARGYSIRGYQLFESREDAEVSDFVQYLGVDADDIVELPEGRYGFALVGLCGYEYDAQEQTPSEFPYSENYSFYAVFTGSYAGEADADDGDLFRPASLVTVAAIS